MCWCRTSRRRVSEQRPVRMQMMREDATGLVVCGWDHNDSASAVSKEHGHVTSTVVVQEYRGKYLCAQNENGMISACLDVLISERERIDKPGTTLVQTEGWDGGDTQLGGQDTCRPWKCVIRDDRGLNNQI